MPDKDSQIERLLQRADRGDRAALDELLDLHRDRLRQMINVRMDSRIAARIDPSDVVQEVLAEAARQLPEYLRDRPLAFYPWLRRLAWKKLVGVHRRHLHARRRSVTCEESFQPILSDQSVMELADRFTAAGTNPRSDLMRKELRRRVWDALNRLDHRDREVVILRHLEQLKLKEIAAVLEITEAAVQSRYRRAVERLHRLLTEAFPEEHP